MGIEAFILPWLFTLALISIFGSRSLVRDIRSQKARLGVVLLADKRTSGASYWSFVIAKALIVAIATLLIFKTVYRSF